MTRAVSDRILKDANGDIGDHLRNHIHLTNCIHLKNHMHKQSPILADRSLMRDLVVLQRSRSLKDPSMSPPSLHSPLATDLLSKRGERDAGVSNNRRPFGIERQKHSRRLSGNSPILASSTAKVAPSKGRVRECRRKKEESIGRNLGSELMGGENEPSQAGNDVVLDTLSRNSELRDKRFRQKGRQTQEGLVKTQSDQLNEARVDGHDVASCSGLSKVKRRKFRGSRTWQATIDSRDSRAESEMSVASNSFVNGGANELDSRDPRNGCGIPWNWSRIHHRGKTFLDSAGKSFSCGLSDQKLKRNSPLPQERDFSDMPTISDHSSSYSKSDAEALPLLVDGSGSQGSADNAAWEHDYSGELGIFADNLLKRKNAYDQHRFRGHQNLTQKYMPRSFRDLVGQNLVLQALTNAVAKRKIGLLYVFYGPHGTGKTSCARIFARALNCQSVEHPKPCGLCDPCIANDIGKSRNIREVGPVSNFDFERIMDLLENPSQYRVFIFDDCDALSPTCWNAILKVVDRVPKRVVFVLVSSSLDVLPHIIISRCQKFFFPKLKDSDIIYTLQWISTKEGLEIDKDALKLIASRSDGSLRDAEMTLDQLTLLGQRISVPLVQELVGLISDEKLVDLLDLALSADTVNTVRNLREIMESGVEPLALMSQLATVITDILAGSYDYMKERPRRKFFRRQSLSKEDMEKLRQALKTLSEAEKQLRMSNDRLTWLTAALLQLAPDQQYLFPSSSAETSFNHSPSGLNNANGRQWPTKSNVGVENLQAGSSSNAYYNAKKKRDRKGGKIEEIWLEVLDKIQINTVKEFMHQEGKLISVSFGADPTVQLMFSSHLAKSRAEKFKKYILQGFESVLGSPLTIEIRYASKKDGRAGSKAPLVLPVSQDGSSHYANPTLLNKDKDHLTQLQPLHFDSTGMGRSEIVEIESSPIEPKGKEEHIDNTQTDRRDLQRRKLATQNPSKSIVRSKVSLAHVIQQAEGWSKRKAVSIAEKLEQENLRLEPRSRSLLCWRSSRVTPRKISRLKIRTRKPRALLKYVSCGKCLSGRSPR